MRSLYRHRQVGWTIIFVFATGRALRRRRRLGNSASDAPSRRRRHASHRPALLIVDDRGDRERARLVLRSRLSQATRRAERDRQGGACTQQMVAGLGRSSHAGGAGFIMSTNSRPSRSRRRTARRFGWARTSRKRWRAPWDLERGTLSRAKSERRVASLRAIRRRRARRGGRLCAAHLVAVLAPDLGPARPAP